MARNQDFFSGCTREEAFCIGERAIFQSRINPDFIFTVLEFQEIAVGKTKPPRVFVVGGSIGNPIGMFDQGVQVSLQFRQREVLVDGDTVIEYVKAVFLKIDDLFASWIFNPSITNVPFARYGPIKHTSACRDFVKIERDFTLKPAKRSANAIPGDAPAKRV
jgi:hypothetical protein